MLSNLFATCNICDPLLNILRKCVDLSSSKTHICHLLLHVACLVLCHPVNVTEWTRFYIEIFFFQHSLTLVFISVIGFCDEIYVVPENYSPSWNYCKVWELWKYNLLLVSTPMLHKLNIYQSKCLNLIISRISNLMRIIRVLDSILEKSVNLFCWSFSSCHFWCSSHVAFVNVWL